MADLPPSYDEVTNPGNPATNPPYPTKASAPYPTGEATPLSPGAPGTAGYSGGAPAPGGVPPPQVYVPPGTATGNIIVTQPTVVINRNVFGYHPSQITCQLCHKQSVTRLEYRTGGATWLTCGLTALVGCWCGCCLIPFCVDGLKDVVHKCGECGQVVGYRKRLD